MKRRLFLWSIPLLTMLTTILSFGSGQCQEHAAGGPVQGTAVSGQESYPLGTGDVLEITFFEQRSLEDSGKLFEVTIDDDGNILLPLIGRIAAAGKNVSSLEKEIQKRLEKFSPNENVSVRVLKYVSQTATLIGAFRKQGVYPLPGKMKLTEFIARNGGLATEADVRKVWVTRLNGDQVLVNLESYYTSGDTSQEFYLVFGDQVFIPVKKESLLVTVGRVAQITVLFLQVVTLAVLLNQ